MKLFTILVASSFCMGFYSCVHFGFALNQPKNDESVVLREIISNYLQKYFSDDYFVSLIMLPSKTKQNRNLFFSLFNDQASIEFAYNILDKLDNQTRGNKRSLNLIVIDDCEQLKNILNESNVHEFHLDQKFLIVITGSGSDNAKTLDYAFTMLWTNGLINAHVLIQNAANTWSLQTFLPYQNGCIALEHLKIESFTESNVSNTMNLSIDQVYPPKVDNFNGCPLYIAPRMYHPSIFRVNTSDGKHNFEGFEVSIISTISQALNSTLIYKVEKSQEIPRVLNLLVQGEVNLTSGLNVDLPERRRYLSPTQAYSYESMVFIYIEGKLRVSSMDTIITTFSSSLWLTLLSILCISIVIILLMKALSRKWRHFYIGGRMNRTPVLNALAVVLGQSIANPLIANGRSFGNFARTLAIFWIFLWFFIRCFYGGAFYSYLRNQPTSPYDTIEKVLASDCKIYVIKPLYPSAMELVANKKRVQLHLENGSYEIFNDFHDMKDDGVIFYIDSAAKYFNMRNAAYRRVTVTKGQIHMFNNVFYFPKKSILREAFNRKIRILQQSGFIQFWISKYYDDRQIKSSNERTSVGIAQLQIATMLETLQICAVLYFISFVVFILEVLGTMYFRIKHILDFFTY